MELDRYHDSMPPGERLTQMLWLMALTSRGRLVMPTVERIDTIKCLVASWEASDEAEAEND